MPRRRMSQLCVGMVPSLVNVNLISVMHLARRFYPMIKQRQGSILIIGSIGVFGLTRTLGDAWVAKASVSTPHTAKACRGGSY
jgi:short-subunit dehydrogenase